VYIVTGDSGNGMTHGTIAGILISDLINKRKNPWQKIYSPSRFKLFSAGDVFVKELVGGTINYLKHKHDNEKHDLLNLKVGEGRIIEENGKMYGVYYDEARIRHFVSVKCTHLGCTVKWNCDEKSWDCPCHGSRFSYTGEVLNGPANRSLKYYKLLPSRSEKERYELFRNT
jgi:Rieske Fe-S protein